MLNNTVAKGWAKYQQCGTNQILLFSVFISLLRIIQEVARRTPDIVRNCQDSLIFSVQLFSFPMRVCVSLAVQKICKITLYFNHVPTLIKLSITCSLIPPLKKGKRLKLSLNKITVNEKKSGKNKSQNYVISL